MDLWFPCSGAGAGGDYIDALEIRGHTWFAMGDVTGHGIQAGLLVMLARTSLHQVLRDQQVQDPGKVLSLLELFILTHCKQPD